MTDISMPKQHKVIINGLILTFVLMCCFTAGSKILSVLTGDTLSLTTRFVLTRLTFWLFFVVILLYVVIKEKDTLLLWPEQAYSIWIFVLSVAAILLVILLGSILIALPFKLWGHIKISDAMVAMLQMSVPVKLLGIITAGVVEELIFRGYMIPRLTLFFKSRHPPVIISSVIFALGHIGYGTALNVLIPLLIGLVFGYHYYRYRNIKILIACHILIDANALLNTALKH
jgi:membrane protease YdiL (CAAX protease family)